MSPADVDTARLTESLEGAGSAFEAGSQALRELATRLSAVATAVEVTEVLTDVGGPALGADSVRVQVLDQDGGMLRMLASRRWSPQHRIQFSAYPVQSPYPTWDAIRSREPVLILSEQDRDARWPTLKGQPLHHRGWMVLPLLVGDRVLGALSLGWADPPSFDQATLQNCTEVARLAAAALLRARRFDAEAEARAAAEDLAGRLGVLEDLTRQLAQATDLASVGDVIVGAGMQGLAADAATIGVIDEAGDTFTVLSTVGLAADEAPRWSRHDIRTSRLARDVLATGRPVALGTLVERNLRYPDLADRGDEFPASVTLPLLVGGRALGIVAYGWRQSRPVDEHDLTFLQAIAAHAASAIDRSHLIEARRQEAETLQRALLPEAISQLQGWQIATCYEPAVEGTQVGGDWYDAFTIEDGLMLVLGDVSGKGVRAAAVMGGVRSALRAFATLDPTPATVLTRLDHYMTRFKPDEMVTCVAVTVNIATGRATYASAGHLPPLLSTTGRSVERLDRATTPPLGANSGPGRRPRTQAVTTIAPGQVLLLYSDGLIERRHHDLHDSIDHLARHVAELPTAHDLADAATNLIGQLQAPDRTIDDIATLLVRRPRADHLAGDVSTAQS